MCKELKFYVIFFVYFSLKNAHAEMCLCFMSILSRVFKIMCDNSVNNINSIVLVIYGVCSRRHVWNELTFFVTPFIFYTNVWLEIFMRWKEFEGVILLYNNHPTANQHVFPRFFFNSLKCLTKLFQDPWKYYKSYFIKFIVNTNFPTFILS